MDPKATLWDILIAAQQIGQPGTLQTHLDDLDEIIQKATNLREWLQSGGFAPEVHIMVMTDKEYIADVKAGWDDSDQALDL